MIIKFKKSFEPASEERLLSFLHEKGYQTKDVSSEVVRIFGVIGDTHKIDTRDIYAYDCVAEVIRIQVPYKKASREFQSFDTVIDLGDGVIIGKDAHLVIAGPCSVEHEAQMMQIGAFLKDQGIHILRGGDGSKTSQSVIYDTNLIVGLISESSITKENYRFGGWALDSTATSSGIIFLDGDSKILNKDLSTKDDLTQVFDNSTITLYAVWLNAEEVMLLVQATVVEDFNAEINSGNKFCATPLNPTTRASVVTRFIEMLARRYNVSVVITERSGGGNNLTFDVTFKIEGANNLVFSLTTGSGSFLNLNSADSAECIIIE